ncbi:MAG: PIN domain-containing protein [Thermoleophilia bacterium]|nr:PIN domain-containing protein [Thermoleophilia bacterium]
MAPSPKTYVIDTNALLNDPDVIHSFSGAEVVVPAVVLKELDDLKRKRTDARVRFNGRKATRVLFDASRNGRLVDGVHLPNGAILRVDATDHFDDPPPALDLSRADDIILALAHSYQRRLGSHATVVSNDLNLLLRAEGIGLDTYRFEGKLEHIQHVRRTPMEWFRDTWFTILLEVLVVVLAFSTGYLYVTRPVDTLGRSLTGIDAITLRSLGVDPKLLEQYYLDRLDKNPSDFDSLVNLGNLVFDDGSRLVEAVDYYRRALAIEPRDANVRTDMGIALLGLGRRHEAILAFQQATVDQPDNALAHYDLGVVLAQEGDLQPAIEALRTSLGLMAQGGVGVPVGDAQILINKLTKALTTTSTAVSQK